MTRKFASAALAAGIVAFNGVAFNADSARADGAWATKAPAPMPQPVVMANDWTGPYLAIGISGTRVSFSSNTVYAPTSASGIGGSVMLGYNLQQDDIVYGAELMANVANISGTASGCGLGATFTCRSSVDNYLAARVRVGYSMGDTLVFGTVGVATDKQGQTVLDGGNVVGHANARHYGPTVGIGVEHSLNDSWGVRGDLEHFRMNSRSYDLAVPGATNVRPSHNAARFSIVNRF